MLAHQEAERLAVEKQARAEAKQQSLQEAKSVKKQAVKQFNSKNDRQLVAMARDEAMLSLPTGDGQGFRGYDVGRALEDGTVRVNVKRVENTRRLAG